MIRAVFFDLDDTLCLTSGTRQVQAKLAHETLTRAGHEVDFEALLESVLKVEPDQTYIRGLGPALRELGLLDTEVGRAALGIWFFDGAEHLVEGFAGCLDALQSLSNRHKLGVITNGPDVIQTRKFEALKIGAHFASDLFVTSEHAGCFKPDERIFRYALERGRASRSNPHRRRPRDRRSGGARRRHACHLVQPRGPRAGRSRATPSCLR